MVWNWQQPDWPDFTWSEARLIQAEEQFLVRRGIVLGTLDHLDKSDQLQLRVETMSDEAVTTSAIEGETLDRASVQSSIRRQLGLQLDEHRSSPAEQGIAEMMVALYRTISQPLDDATLGDWHAMVMRGRRDLRIIGGYRTHDEPMQVVSGKVYAPTVHFEAPPSSRVPDEMAAFLRWFHHTAPGEAAALPAITRAGIAHLYFESIHPFEDGNGRIGRAVSEKALAQGRGDPVLTGLAPTILNRRRAYYDQLEQSSRSNHLDDWLAWFAGITLEAQQRTHARAQFLIDKSKLLRRLDGQLNSRQEKVLLRVLAEGPDGFRGGLSAGNYISIAKTSPATARRDLTDLIDKGALRRTGERRHARYHLTIPLRPVAPVTIDRDGNIVS